MPARPRCSSSTDRAGSRPTPTRSTTCISPVVTKLQERRGIEPGGITAAVGSRITGLEVGALLGFLAGKVLGQFDPFTDDGSSDGRGRLLLVAPNIVHAERELDVDASDFRLWVCLHEETHRVQFTAVPWLRDHLQSEIDRLVDDVDVDPARMAAMLGDAFKRTGEIVRGSGGSGAGRGQPARRVRHPGAARGHRPRHRRHVAARGPRRRGHGRRRAPRSSARSH